MHDIDQQNDLCTQGRLGSAWTLAQSDQSLCCAHEKNTSPELDIECRVNNLSCTRMRAFRNNHEFRILRLTVHRKSTLKYCTRQVMVAFLCYFQIIIRQLTFQIILLKIINYLVLKLFIFGGILQVLNF